MEKFDFKEACKGCTIASETDCTLQSTEFGCVRETHEAATEMLTFFHGRCGADDSSIIEIICNGEHSDLYAQHVADLFTRLEKAVGFAKG